MAKARGIVQWQSACLVCTAFWASSAQKLSAWIEQECPDEAHLRHSDTLFKSSLEMEKNERHAGQQEGRATSLHELTASPLKDSPRLA